MKPTGRSQAGKRASRPERAKGDKAWDAADWKYSALVASSMVPLFGKKLTPEEEMDGLEELKNVLVIAPGAIGDVLMSTPAIRRMTWSKWTC